MSIITEQMVQAAQQVNLHDISDVAMADLFEAALSDLPPEAKRDLAAQLLRAASADEGHPDE
jgi:predicted amino acid-binding ACT domain protein